MNILITINKGYVKQLNVLLNSIQYANPNESFDVYILHKNLEQEDIETIQKGLDLEKFFIHSIFSFLVFALYSSCKKQSLPSILANL